jgi:hypothetical protein
MWPVRQHSIIVTLVCIVLFFHADCSRHSIFWKPVSENGGECLAVFFFSTFNLQAAVFVDLTLVMPITVGCRGERPSLLCYMSSSFIFFLENKFLLTLVDLLLTSLA